MRIRAGRLLLDAAQLFIADAQADWGVATLGGVWASQSCVPGVPEIGAWGVDRKFFIDHFEHLPLVDG
ncbi:hypothetical protein C5Y96_03315 [Blastopirellula marina]|uniref:Uncharacterized protein n=1 Tax=Blastopirellula marina TaxID=124 RepID=A0A2S8G445_9BACT|nr:MULTISPECIES: hypothetical protein [Pirellulaceae]PQO38914.1 hypothetical protein C5Y96_03315 [Blastopirellula marina]RCS55222.1 hypothetical protein DTL36_03320 [Bremerella cremea]